MLALCGYEDALSASPTARFFYENIRATIGVSPDEPQNLRLYRRLWFTERIKDRHYDPCAMDADMQSAYDETGFMLLSKKL